MYTIWSPATIASRGANTLLLDNALATMGPPASVGMMGGQGLHPDRPVLAGVCDGGFPDDRPD